MGRFGGDETNEYLGSQFYSLLFGILKVIVLSHISIPVICHRLLLKLARTSSSSVLFYNTNKCMKTCSKNVEEHRDGREAWCRDGTCRDYAGKRGNADPVTTRLMFSPKSYSADGS